MTEFGVLRSHAGVTVAELAAQLGFSEEVVTDWDEGRSLAPMHIMHVLDFMARQDPLEATPVPKQEAFPWAAPTPAAKVKTASRTGSFTDNMKQPIHRWFRYSAGFSAEWVAKVAREHSEKASASVLFDPFAGSGTSLLAAQSVGVPSAGAERHPFVLRVAQVKLAWSDIDLEELRETAQRVLDRAKAIAQMPNAVPDLLTKCYSENALQRLFALRGALESESTPDTKTGDTLWLALTAILRECSGVGTAQWQYVLPNKSKSKIADPYDAFHRRVEMFCADVAASTRALHRPIEPTILRGDDARTLRSFDDLRNRVSLVVTSPPYPNNYDYADATRLEMTFWGEVASWGDLHHAVRNQLMRSCSQHTAAEKLSLEELLSDQMITPIRDELSKVCRELEVVRDTKGGKKTYHTMVAAYFADLAKVWSALRPLCADGAEVCFVIGDSAPYGVYVPADRWLISLAMAAGFQSPRFEKIRDRNLKWKNRKHRVPLKEGNLWLRA